MNYITDNMNIFIIVIVAMVITYYLSTRYINSTVENEVTQLKKRLKKLQVSINKLQGNQSNQKTKLPSPQQPIDFDDNPQYIDNDDADSYFDPTK